MKLSLIIAGYGHAELWKSCLGSLMPLKYSEVEFICVDDASGDKEAEKLLRSYSAQDPRIVPVIRNTNGGVCVARNDGLEIAKGEYLGFMDFDDEMCPEVITRAIEFLDSHRDCDICTFGVRTVWKDLGLTVLHAFDNDFILDVRGPDLYESVYQKIFKPRLLNFIWNKIYRRKFIEEHRIRFEPHAICYEDIVFNLDCLIAGAKIGGIRDVGYCWYRLSSGTTLAKYRPWIEEGITMDSDRKQRWATCTGASFDKNGFAYEPACMTKAEQIFKNMYRLQSPLSCHKRLEMIRKMFNCSMAMAIIMDVKGVMYHIFRRHLYYKPLARFHIKRIMPNIREWDGRLFAE